MSKRRRHSMFSYNVAPQCVMKRSKFPFAFPNTLTMNVGYLYPLDWREVYPGDTFVEAHKIVCRSTSPFIRNVMDNAYFEEHTFFVPYRTIYDKFVNVMGQNSESAWDDAVDYEVPYFDDCTVSRGGVLDYLHVCPGSYGKGLSVMPPRAFAKIYDEYFRDQNVIDPMYIHTGELGLDEAPNSNPWSPSNYTGMLPKVSKFHDRFTSALPDTQRGDPVTVNIGDLAPVVTGSDHFNIAGGPGSGSGIFASGYSTADTSLRFAAWDNYGGVWEDSSGGAFEDDPQRILFDGIATNTPTFGNTGKTFGISGVLDGASYDPDWHYEHVYPSNLWADLSASQNVKISDLRDAWQLQRALERLARGGSRYTEVIRSFYGVASPDQTQQRAQYLNGRRTPLSVLNVVQHNTQLESGGTVESPLGQVAGMSWSNCFSRMSKSFTEHGILMTVGFIRQNHTYQQGLNPAWVRHKRFDFYMPPFAHISQQPIYSYELYAQNQPLMDYDEENKRIIFGYQDAWDDLRTFSGQVAGQARTASAVGDVSFDVWHFADWYNSAPVLSQEFIEETPTYVDRTLSVPSTTADQFIVQVGFEGYAVRVMPLFGTPGLVDHY